MISILVLSDQKEIFSEIEDALRDEYITHLAASAAQLSDILVDGEIKIVILDAAFLKTTNQEAIVETLSFFPELTLIAAVESGETKNLVNLFQSFEIYRYLQKPFTPNQIKKCISAAERKHAKNKAHSNLSNNDEGLIESTKSTYIIFVPIVILLWVFFAFFFQKDKDNSIKVESALTTTTGQSNNRTDIANTKSELLSLEHESVNLSAKTGLSINSNKKEIETIIAKAKEAGNNKHYFEPEKESALHYYLLALDIEQDNLVAVSGLNKLTQLINDELNSFLSNKKYEKSVVIVKSIKQQHPEYQQITNLEASLIKKGNELLANAKTLSAKGQYESALQQLNNAAILLSGKAQGLTETRITIETLIQKQKNADKLISIINNRIDAGNIIHPDNDSAKFYLDKLKKAHPDYIANKEIETKFVSELIKQAENAIKSNELDKAKAYIKEVSLFNAQKVTIVRLEKQLGLRIKQNENNKLKQEQSVRLQKLSALASDAIEKNNLVYPENSNAKYYLQSALKIEPDNKKIKSQIEALVSLLLIQIETDIAENTLASASSKIKKAKELDIKIKELSLLEIKLNNAIEKR